MMNSGEHLHVILTQLLKVPPKWFRFLGNIPGKKAPCFLVLKKWLDTSLLFCPLYPSLFFMAVRCLPNPLVCPQRTLLTTATV